MTDQSTKLPLRVRLIVDACRSGQVLCKTYRNRLTGESEPTFTLHPSGRSVPALSAQEAIDSGLLTPNEDGLFDATSSQTWKRRGGSHMALILSRGCDLLRGAVA